MRNRHFLSVVVGTAVASFLIVVGSHYRAHLPFLPQTTSISERPYGSIADLTETADVVVIGSVVGVAGRQIDWGTEDTNLMAKREDGSPVVFHALLVSEVLRGEAEDTIFIAGTDFRVMRVAGGREIPLRRRDTVLLFLHRKTSADTPGITLYNEYFVPVGMDNGVFDLQGSDQVVPRAPELFTRREFPLADVRQQIRGHGSGTGANGR